MQCEKKWLIENTVNPFMKSLYSLYIYVIKIIGVKKQTSKIKT